MLGQNEQLQAYQDRFRYLYAILIAMGCVLFLRLWYLQILKGEEFKQFAEENRLKKIKIEAPRGMVFDRNRQILLDNHPTFNVTITPQYFRAASLEQRDSTIQKLSKITHTPPKVILETLAKARRQPSFQPVVVKKNLTMDEVSLIEMEKLTLIGVEVSTGIRRTNVNGLIGSHLLGYIAEIDADELPKVNRNVSERPYQQGDSLGKSGLEMQWENVLRGIDGVEYIEVDAFGRKKLLSERTSGGQVVGEIPPKPAIPGKNIVLTIDEDLQKAAAEAFIKDNRTGAVVALDPNNGEVLAMLSWPSFDSTEFSVGIRPEYWKSLTSNEDKPLRDKTIIDHYSPGSTFKIVSALAGLEEGLINENTIVNAPSFKFGGKVWHDWKKEGHGPTDVVKSLYRSVDVYYYKLATRMEIDVLARYARDLGLGQRTGIALPGEIPGIVPDTDWKRRNYKTEWYPGETLSVIIGQGALTTTPIQLANMIAGIANGGTIYKPRLLKFIEGQDGAILEKTEPEVIHQARWSEKNLNLVRKGIEDVIMHDNGTAHAQFVPGIEAAGKTGTAQVIRFTTDTVFKDCNRLERKYRHHGLFVAYAPIKDPKIAVAVVAEHSCGGSTAAAPIAMAMIKKYLAKIDPEKYGEEALKEAKTAYWKRKSGAAPAAPAEAD